MNYSRDIYGLETVQGRLQEEGHTVLFKAHTKDLQFGHTKSVLLSEMFVLAL